MEAESLETPPRVLVTKIGLDGHDRGSRIVAAYLRDAGMEVIYTPPWQTIGAVVDFALQEDVDVILRSGSPAELLQALEALNLDVVLMNRPPAGDAVSPFVAHRLAEQPVNLVGTPHRVAGGGAIAELLTGHPVILPTADSSVRTAFDALADRIGIRPQIAAEVDDMAMMRLLAREDVGLAVLPPIVVKDELASGLLHAADVLPGITETFYAVTVRRRFPNALLRALLQADGPAAGPN